MQRICIFCGSSPGLRPAYVESARRLGGLLARRGLSLVFGGGRVGLMGAVADAALEHGGHVTGVIPKFLFTKELDHRGVQDLRVVGSMHERKALMADLADAFVALPGGYGTLDEFCEILTWAQLGLHQKPCGLLNVDGYYDPFLAFIDQAAAHGFIQPPFREWVLNDDDPERLLDRMRAYRPPAVTRRLERGQR